MAPKTDNKLKGQDTTLQVKTAVLMESILQRFNSCKETFCTFTSGLARYCHAVPTADRLSRQGLTGVPATRFAGWYAGVESCHTWLAPSSGETLMLSTCIGLLVWELEMIWPIPIFGQPCRTCG